MLNFGMWEIAILVALALVVVGPERLPTMVRFLGRQYGKLMRASRELRRAFMLEADRVDSEQRTAELKKRREVARNKLKEQMEKAKAKEAPVMPLSQDNEDYTPFDADEEDTEDDVESGVTKISKAPVENNEETIDGEGSDAKSE